jgi:hypothetical protein
LAAGAGALDSVGFVYEQDAVFFGFQGSDHGLEFFFELTAVL